MSEVPPRDRQLIIPTTTSRWHCFLVNTCEQVHTILSLYYLGARCWERLRAGEGEDRGWDGWMASPTWWTWVWASSGNWRWTRKPGVLLFTGSQRVPPDWATELNWAWWRWGWRLYLNLQWKVEEQLKVSAAHRVSLPWFLPSCCNWTKGSRTWGGAKLEKLRW